MESLYSLTTSFIMDRIRPLLTRTQVVPPPPSAPKPKPPHLPNLMRRGQCTHITMVRLHTTKQCQMCHKTPNIGWLYACRQDWLLDHQDSMACKGIEEPLSVPDDSDYFEVTARMATSLNMSSSVVNQIRAGAYTFDEVDKLISQKEHLNSVIRAKEQAAVDGTLTTLAKPVPGVVASVGASATSALSNAAVDAEPIYMDWSAYSPAGRTKGRKMLRKNDRCNYMVCHNCRPFLQDRIFTTVDTVMRGEQPPITEEEIKTLPMLLPSTIRGLGLSYVPQSIERGGLGDLQRSGSLDITMQYRDDTGEGADSPPSSLSSVGSSLYDDNFDNDNGSVDPYPCPGSGVCPVYSRASGCAYDSGFDDGHRAYNHGFFVDENVNPNQHASQTTPDRSRNNLRYIERGATDTPGDTVSTASSISLPTPTTSPLTREMPDGQVYEYEHAAKGNKAATVCGVMSPSMNFQRLRLGSKTGLDSKESDSSFDSELEVDGGVALTEEAVGTGLPDIVTRH